MAGLGAGEAVEEAEVEVDEVGVDDGVVAGEGDGLIEVQPACCG